MIRADALGAVERAAIIEEVLSVMRHDVGNKLSAMRNAVLYIRRRIEGTELAAEDQRVGDFLQLIDGEAISAHAIITERIQPARHFSRSVRHTRAADCVDAALRYTRLASDGEPALEATASPGVVNVDPYELAVAVRCLIENAIEASPEGPVRVSGRVVDAHYVIEVVDPGDGLNLASEAELLEPFFTSKQGHAGLGLNIARRVARRHRGDLSLGPGPTGSRAALQLPLAPVSDDPKRWAP